ncbi:recognition of host receptor [Salmonella phage SW16-7]|nr:recognition of host receptor [Salmonella phage SW16-7]
MRKNIAIAIVGLALSTLVFNANAALYLKSSGDQWSAAMADLQNGYNEGVSSNKFNRFYAVLGQRFSLDNSTKEDILNMFKSGSVNVWDQNTVNTHLNNSGGGNTGGGNSSGSNSVDKDDYAADKAEQTGVDAAQDTAIAGKVDKDQFKTDQDRQDSALSKEVQDRKDGDKALSDRIDGKVDNSDFTTDQKRQDDALTQETSDRQSGDQALSVRIDTKVDQTTYDDDKSTQSEKDISQDGKIAAAQGTAGVAVAKADKAQDTANRAESKANKAQVTANTAVKKAEHAQVSADKAQVTANRAESKADYAIAGVDNAYSYIEQTRNSLNNTNKSVAQNSHDIANHEKRIGDLERQVNTGFSNLGKQIDKVEKKSNAGIAGVAAMANIPQVTEYQSFSVGAGVGYRDDQSAIAVGASARIGQNTVGKLSVSADTQSGYTVGAGISYGW